MFDPDAKGKCLRLHDKLLAGEHLKGISRRVPRCKYTNLAGNLFPAVHRDTADLSARVRYIRDFRVKTVLSSQAFYLFAHTFENIHKNVGANMRLLLIQDRFLRPVLCKRLPHELCPKAGVFHGSVEFAVRKCAGTSLSELDICIRVQ